MVESTSERHSLTEIDREARVGVCSICGPTRVRIRVGKVSECWAVRMRHQHKRNPETMRARWLRTSFGISLDDYKRMLTEQGGVCAICGSPPGDRRLAVDHDHDSGHVRGLLCRTCNVGLGHFGDEPARLSAALAYLREAR